MDHEVVRVTAFAGQRRMASGPLAEVVKTTKEAMDRGETATILIFDETTAQQVEVDFRGTLDDVLARLPEKPRDETPRGPGRPKLGVVAREVTLLPRHWEWLNGQPGGASVALRKLVEAARRTHDGQDRTRRSQEVAYRFMTAMAGNEPGYEDAIRALFAKDQAQFEAVVQPWPTDVRDEATKFARQAFETTLPS